MPCTLLWLIDSQPSLNCSHKNKCSGCITSPYCLTNTWRIWRAWRSLALSQRLVTLYCILLWLCMTRSHCATCSSITESCRSPSMGVSVGTQPSTWPSSSTMLKLLRCSCVEGLTPTHASISLSWTSYRSDAPR